MQQMFAKQRIMWKFVVSCLVVCTFKNAIVSGGTPTKTNHVTDISSSFRPTFTAAVASTRNNTTNENGKLAAQWLRIASAVPTILIFIVCVIIIAVKNHYDENPNTDESSPLKDHTDGLLQLARNSQAFKKKSKQGTNQEIYDVMLAKFKADKNKKRSFVGRKSSQIRIEGMASRSPKSLAKKHIIIGKLNEEDLTPDGNSSALGQLVQLSTHTFIGSKLIEDMADESEWESDNSHIRSILERSRENLSEARKILPDDVNEALLPEDLEEAFRNFGNWEESLI